MSDLRKAAEMAFEALDAYSWEQVDAARTALRQALAQSEQETVKCMYPYCETAGGCDGPCSKSFSTGQPNREWVGLTDEEIAQGHKESWVTEQAWQSAVWWAEAKLKEKNGG